MAREQGTSTLEELLLACAVKRHGTKSWDSIAMELQTRRSSSLTCITPQSCKDKFNDLKRRFMHRNDAESVSLDSMMGELRRIRVDELRREVQRHDVSIVSLESKVKRLVDEREQSLKEETDLNRGKSDGGEGKKLFPEIIAGLPATAAGGKSDERNDRSRSNSTSQEPEKVTMKDVPTHAVKVEEVQVKPEPNEPNGVIQQNPVRTGLKSDRDRDCSSNGKKRYRKSGDDMTGGDAIFPVTKQGSAVKSDSLIKFLGIIRSHRVSLWFEQRLRSQGSERYKKMIRQHIDLQTIETKVVKGVYSDCIRKFFRDLLLLFNNAIVFNKKNSPKHVTALELRLLVLKEMKDKRRKLLQPVIVKPEPDQPLVFLPEPNKSFIPTKTVSSLTSIKATLGIASKKENEKDQERTISNNGRNSRTNKTVEKEHPYGDNELSSHDAFEIKVERKDSTSKKKKNATRLSEMMDNDDDVSKDEGKDSRGEGEKKTVGRKRNGRGSERVGRSSDERGEREDSEKVKRGVSRLSKRATTEPTENRDAHNGENEVEAGSPERPRKRSRR